MSKKNLNEKQETTLKRMQETRTADSMFIRETIKAKLDWAKNEKTKGITVLEKQMQQIRDNKEILIKLDAVINILEELLEAKKEIKEESKKE